MPLDRGRHLRRADSGCKRLRRGLVDVELHVLAVRPGSASGADAVRRGGVLFHLDVWNGDDDSHRRRGRFSLL